MYQRKRTKGGTKKHLIIDEAHGQVTWITLFDYRIIESIQGDVRDAPINLGDNWLLAKKRCLDAGLKVYADQWQAPCIEISSSSGKYWISCTATHPLVGKRTIKAEGISLTEAKTNFWSAWNEMAVTSGVHTHLNLSQHGYQVSW
tara:strand:- start:113 stop:547 length:435 start_codon:yes stop_codon:yes gene_type:complete